MSIDDAAVAVRVSERQRARIAETDGLVRSPLATPMLQPWEVYDQELFDLEMLRVFGRSWVWLGDTEDLQQPGDYISGVIGAQPVVVVRTADGQIKGYLNNCRHRASTVVSGSVGNCGSSMVCPYHNWAYNLDGQLIGVPDRVRMYPDGLPLDEYGLVPIRIEVAWGKLVFGCLSHKAPTFREWIEPIADRYDSYRFDTFTRYQRELNQEYPINWKAFVENSNDDYHVRFVHRRINAQRKQLDTVVRFAGRTCSGYKPHPESFDTTGGRTDLDPEVRSGHFADFIYPNLTPLPYATVLILVRADPLAPDRTRLVSRIYGIDRTPDEQAADIENLELTNREDTDMVTVLMANLRSPFYRVGPPTTWEGRAAHVMQLIRDDVATPLAPDEFR
ncbi:MAG: aromatic ring-hydroxylating dioxygenase subunit alpha [Actinobacteria bacterium]|nr:aromatic ring-hydroxylating dioxygenase subunit alpha [Actinomycetota bacterium]